MKTETKSFAEYKAPKCKCVEFYMNRAFMQEVSSPYGAVGAAGNDFTLVNEDEDY